ncbi:hypothetical protein ACWT_5364 [Actinoplanes sp. SE50]|uniref:hypothetical protein n=1 Tax=unclassified Actinoplanes TaxID=2626549 RepID=UPI00023EC324|nr:MULTISPECIES: hypothetical protein [unclassified Actinoplanes]AEV86382.1 hypothetical protein ACPL_5495 [Actinoplanes sp. SE50/110]ATO84779.1 hypothetical protein ACWT_5364 [Actinoplanes sp. SE50]SLM02189.1 hypothetical protein ACSP50_5427 [Actinoplanes sp. SE50/110]
MTRRPLSLVALLLLAGCTTGRAHPAAAPAPAVCTGGQTVFAKAVTGKLLTGVTPVEKGLARDVVFTDPYDQINTRTAAVRTAATAPAEQIYRELAGRYGEDHPLAPYGEVYHPATGESFSMDRTGRFVAYEWLRTLDVPFHYTCGGTTTDGTVITWSAVLTDGILNCDEPAPAATTADDPEREARRLRC